MVLLSEVYLPYKSLQRVAHQYQPLLISLPRHRRASAPATVHRSLQRGKNLFATCRHQAIIALPADSYNLSEHGDFSTATDIS